MGPVLIPHVWYQTFLAMYTPFIRCKEKRFWHVLNFAVFFFLYTYDHSGEIIVI